MNTNDNMKNFYKNLLNRSSQIAAKDGSQALDVLTSLRQYQHAYDIVQKYIPVGADVLDWGGGGGHFAFFLEQNGYQATIFAFSTPEFVLPEMQNGRVLYTAANINEPVKLPFADNSFDAVCSIGVLEHVREIGGDERASLKEISRILKPGGIFFCYHLPNKNSWIEWMAKRFGTYHHQYTYTAPQIRSLFNGFLEIRACTPYAILPRNSLRHLPKILVNSRMFAYLFDTIDFLLGKLLPRIHQNWLIVATKA
jgi:ubiquinone/menaquinone biosynthesis C-methylase UbiE